MQKGLKSSDEKTTKVTTRNPVFKWPFLVLAILLFIAMLAFSFKENLNPFQKTATLQTSIADTTPHPTDEQFEKQAFNLATKYHKILFLERIANDIKTELNYTAAILELAKLDPTFSPEELALLKTNLPDNLTPDAELIKSLKKLNFPIAVNPITTENIFDNLSNALKNSIKITKLTDNKIESQEVVINRAIEEIQYQDYHRALKFAKKIATISPELQKTIQVLEAKSTSLAAIDKMKTQVLKND